MHSNVGQWDWVVITGYDSIFLYVQLVSILSDHIVQANFVQFNDDFTGVVVKNLFCVVVISWRAGNGGGFTFRQLKLHCLTHFRSWWNVAYNTFCLILKWLFSKCTIHFCVFKMYNRGWAKSRRVLDCFFTIMAEISGRYWQILDRSGKKIILLSPLTTSDIFEVTHKLLTAKDNGCSSRVVFLDISKAFD